MADTIRDFSLALTGTPAIHAAVPVLLEVRNQAGLVKRITVDGSGFLIGRGDFCDLQLEDHTQPLVHSELHLQGAVVWIEAAEENQSLVVNGDRCRRRALQDGDCVVCGGTEIVVHIGRDIADIQDRPLPMIAEDLSLLSADELCDRIIQDEVEVAAFERGQRTGWQTLLQSVEAALLDDAQAAVHPRLGATIAELRTLSEQLAAESEQLAHREAEFRDATVENEDPQTAISRRLEQLLEGFGETDLRASA